MLQVYILHGLFSSWLLVGIYLCKVTKEDQEVLFQIVLNSKGNGVVRLKWAWRQERFVQPVVLQSCAYRPVSPLSPVLFVCGSCTMD